MTETNSLSYKDAGVDIDAGNELVNRIKGRVKKTFGPEVMGGIGGFGALFKLPVEQYRQPVLVSGTDGVGTKLKLAIDLNHHDTIGIDLVAMCVNDILTLGARPLFFLDYYATGKLSVDVAASVISGIAQGCEIAGAALIGGETAEMPGMYSAEDYDLAGFCVGIVEQDKIIDGTHIKAGQQIIGLPSSGLHSNGYSLARKCLEVSNARLDQKLGDSSLGHSLLEPTRIYVQPVLKLLETINIFGMAHITGGGLSENIPRVLPQGHQAVIRSNSWAHPPVFSWLQEAGNITLEEMWRTFNCGIGYILIVDECDLDDAMRTLRHEGENPVHIGHVETGPETPCVKLI